MSTMIGSEEEARLRQEIISQCTWSDTYSSLRHILKRTANQLPLLVSFMTDDQQTTDGSFQTVYFFDRNATNKLLLTPLRQHEDQPEQFDVYPHHCTFVIPDFFKGLFEFVLNGQRCGRIFSDLEQLTAYVSNFQYIVAFMARERVLAFYQDTKFSRWSSKKYSQGAIFRAERIHRATTTTRSGRQIPNNYLECIDEDGYGVFIKMDQPGRFSIIATSPEQQINQPEIYIHSTQTDNVGQLIKRVTSYYDKKQNNNCIRLVRGSVPHNFNCQYFTYIRQHVYDVLIGLTQEGLVIEWNLESHAPCRYATNLNDVLGSLYGTVVEQTLESYIEQARTHYKQEFQLNVQMTSSIDWVGFFQFWKWTGNVRRKQDEQNGQIYQSRHRFHVIASVQDLSDNARTLISAYKFHRTSSEGLPSVEEAHTSRRKKSASTKQRSLFSHMSKLIQSPILPRKLPSHRSSRHSLRPSSFGLPNGESPFDDSIYESNPNQSVSPRDIPSNGAGEQKSRL